MSAARAAQVLQGMADKGDVDAAGNIIHIIGGKPLADDLRLSKRSFERYVRYLVEHRIIVLLSRGGVVYGDRKPRNAANIYGIPARPGSLDHRRVRRREQTMKPTGKRDKRGRPAFAPDVTHPGAQATLWPQRRQPTPREAGYAEPGQQRLDQTQNMQQRIGPQVDADHPTPAAETTTTGSRPVCAPDNSPGAQATERPSPLDNGAAAPSEQNAPGHAGPSPSDAGASPGRRSVSSDLPPPCRYPRVTVTLPPRHRDAPPYTMEPSPLSRQNHGARSLREHGSEPPPGDLRAARASAKSGRVSIRHIDDPEILRDDRRLKDLLWQERARRATSATPLQWFGAAERALRVTHDEGGDPCALFAHLVNTKRWSYVSDEDEARARRRLDACEMSPDAKLALAACQVARRTGRDGLALMRLQQKITQERWQQLLEELRRHGYEEARPR